MTAVSIDVFNLEEKQQFTKIANTLLLDFDLNQNINELNLNRQTPFYKKFFEYCNQKHIKTPGALSVRDICEILYLILKK